MACSRGGGAQAQSPRRRDARPAPAPRPPRRPQHRPTLAPVRVTGQAPAAGERRRLGRRAARRSAPLQATTIDAAQMRDAGARRLSDLTRFDAAVTDAYDTEGYIDYFTVRGFVIDNRFNYRRDGLPINAETSIPLDNKARVDILKGLSGMQAGTSAPGGLVDLVVKRPLDAPLRSAFVEWRERGSVLGAVDLSQRFGADDAFGVRLNAAAEHIDPRCATRSGHRNVLALAGDWRVGSGTLLEAEVETSHRSQPSVPGFSLLGDVRAGGARPAPQPQQPAVVAAGGVRRDDRIAAPDAASSATDWRLVAHGRDAAAAAPTTASPSRSAASTRAAARRHLLPRPLLPERQLRPLRLPQRERAAPQQRARPLAARPGRDRLAGARRSASACMRTIGAQPLRDVRRSTSPAPATSTARSSTPPDPTLTDAEHQPRRALDRALRCATRSPSAARTTAWLGARHTRLDAQRRRHRRLRRAPTIRAVVHDAVRRAELRASRRGQLVYASWGRASRATCADVPLDLDRRCRATPTPARRCRAAEEPAGRDRHQGRRRARRVERWRRSTSAGRASATSAPAAGAATPDCTRGLVGDAAPPRRRGQRAPGAAAPGACAPARNGCRRARGGHARPGARRQAADQRARPSRRGCRRGYAVDRRAGPAPARRPAATRARARCCPTTASEIPSVTPLRPRRALRAKSSAGATWTLRAGVDNVFDRRAWRESAVPVQPRLPVPAGAAHVAGVAAGRPLSGQRRERRWL